MVKTPSFAGFWIRLLAYCIDGFIVNLIGLFSSMSDLYTEGTALLLIILYFCGFWAWKAATPGEMLLKLKIVSVDGKPLTATQIALRFIGLWIGAAAFFIGFFWIAFDAQKQSWADKMAKTFVVKNS